MCVLTVIEMLRSIVSLSGSLSACILLACVCTVVISL